MPKFQYKAKNIQGKMIEGIYDAPNENAVIEMIREQNYFHLEINEVINKAEVKSIGSKKVGKKDISIFCRQFASILKAGVPLVQCINMLSEQSENKILKAILINVNEEIQKGSTLSQALKNHQDKFPSFLINMIEAGEASGTLDDTLEVMALHYEKDYKLQQKVQSALIYPAVIVVVTIGVIVFLLIAVVPMFSNMFAEAGSSLPGVTQLLVDMSNFLKSKWYIIVLIISMIIFAIRAFLASEEGRLKFDKLKTTMPVFSDLQINIISARFSRTMSTLMSTGVSITEALEITGRILGNSFAEEGMKEVVEDVKQGKGLAGPIRSLDLFPPMIENMVLLGEQSGTLVEMLEKTAEFYEEAVDRSVDRLTAMIEPAIIVVLGGSVGFIVVAMMLPMFDMMNAIQNM